MTLEELRYRRALEAVKVEVGKERMLSVMGNTKEKVQKNGLRGLLFSNKIVGSLKFVDYLIIGFQVSKIMTRMWRKFK